MKRKRRINNLDPDVTFFVYKKANFLKKYFIFRGQLDFVQKDVSEFRDYTIDDTDPVKERVRRTYRLMHLNQTVDYVTSE